MRFITVGLWVLVFVLWMWLMTLVLYFVPTPVSLAENMSVPLPYLLKLTIFVVKSATASRVLVVVLALLILLVKRLSPGVVPLLSLGLSVLGVLAMALMLVAVHWSSWQIFSRFYDALGVPGDRPPTLMTLYDAGFVPRLIGRLKDASKTLRLSSTGRGTDAHPLDKAAPTVPFDLHITNTSSESCVYGPLTVTCSDNEATDSQGLQWKLTGAASPTLTIPPHGEVELVGTLSGGAHGNSQVTITAEGPVSASWWRWKTPCDISTTFVVNVH